MKYRNGDSDEKKTKAFSELAGDISDNISVESESVTSASIYTSSNNSRRYGSAANMSVTSNMSADEDSMLFHAGDHSDRNDGVSVAGGRSCAGMDLDDMVNHYLSEHGGGLPVENNPHDDAGSSVGIDYDIESTMTKREGYVIRQDTMSTSTHGNPDISKSKEKKGAFLKYRESSVWFKFTLLVASAICVVVLVGIVVLLATNMTDNGNEGLTNRDVDSEDEVTLTATSSSPTKAPSASIGNPSAILIRNPTQSPMATATVAPAASPTSTTQTTTEKTPTRVTSSPIPYRTAAPTAAPSQLEAAACVDTVDATFVVAGVERNCDWLSLPTALVFKSILCQPTELENAYSLCPKTCNRCD